MGLPIREYRIAAVHQRFGGPWRVSESAGSNPATHTKQTLKLQRYVKERNTTSII